jgi:hypothetical protein
MQNGLIGRVCVRFYDARGTWLPHREKLVHDADLIADFLGEDGVAQ